MRSSTTGTKTKCYVCPFGKGSSDPKCMRKNPHQEIGSIKCLLRHIRRMHLKQLFCGKCWKRFGIPYEKNRHEKKCRNPRKQMDPELSIPELHVVLELDKKLKKSCKTLEDITDTLMENGKPIYDYQNLECGKPPIHSGPTCTSSATPLATAESSSEVNSNGIEWNDFDGDSEGSQDGEDGEDEGDEEGEEDEGDEEGEEDEGDEEYDGDDGNGEENYLPQTIMQHSFARLNDPLAWVS